SPPTVSAYTRRPSSYAAPARSGGEAMLEPRARPAIAPTPHRLSRELRASLRKPSLTPPPPPEPVNATVRRTGPLQNSPRPPLQQVIDLPQHPLLDTARVRPTFLTFPRAVRRSVAARSQHSVALQVVL